MRNINVGTKITIKSFKYLKDKHPDLPLWRLYEISKRDTFILEINKDGTFITDIDKLLPVSRDMFVIKYEKHKYKF